MERETEKEFPVWLKLAIVAAVFVSIVLIALLCGMSPKLPTKRVTLHGKVFYVEALSVSKQTVPPTEDTVSFNYGYGHQVGYAWIENCMPKYKYVYTYVNPLDGLTSTEFQLRVLFLTTDRYYTIKTVQEDFWSKAYAGMVTEEVKLPTEWFYQNSVDIPLYVYYVRFEVCVSMPDGEDVIVCTVPCRYRITDGMLEFIPELPLI